MPSRKLIKYCQDIADLYRVKLHWMEGSFGMYLPGTNKIFVGVDAPDSVVISIFCHELGHYENFLTGKYARYHRSGDFRKRFKFKRSAAKYALKAELYTEKVGRRLCKEWFPGVRYHQAYRWNEANIQKLMRHLFGRKRKKRTLRNKA